MAILCADGKFCASICGLKIALRDVATLRVIRSYSCVDKIDVFEWSPDSKFFLCGFVFSQWTLASFASGYSGGDSFKSGQWTIRSGGVK